MDAHHFHDRVDAHRHGSRLSDVILGGQDGLVNVLGVILGLAAATAESRVVLAGGLAAAIAESLSMAAVAYTSLLAEHALFESERARERRHIATVPELERDEIRAMYRKKGFDGELLDQIVDTITSNPDVWVAVMMTEELGLEPVSRARALRASLVVGLSALIGSLLPLGPFFFIGVHPAEWTSVVVAAAALFAIGAYKAMTTVGSWLWSGLELAAIGMASALAGWGIGLLFQ
jgi:VIT1/CCC1 family predicted Fe2+/Mn2+ transporter